MSKIVGIGIDLEPIESFRKKKFSSSRRFYERIFSKSEIQYCVKFRNSSARFAARYCAKEALVKAAHTVTPLFITDSEVVNRLSGAPYLRQRSKRPMVRRFFAQHEVFLSLSHTDDMAIAFVVLVRKKKGQ